MSTRHGLSLSLTAIAIGACIAGCGQSHGLDGDAGTTMPPADGGGADGGRDGGAVDAGSTPTECDGLGPAACLEAFCVPVFDDACCPLCGDPGPCADCTRPTYTGCAPLAASPCRGAACGTAPTWACGPAAPECGGANAVALDACDRTGCVPAYPSGDGAPALDTAVCVPITGASCTVACRRLPPPCPDGTTAEGDGSCYTDRCIPAFVCEA